MDPSRLEFSLPPEEPGCVHRPWLNAGYSEDTLQAIFEEECHTVPHFKALTHGIENGMWDGSGSACA